MSRAECYTVIVDSITLVLSVILLLLDFYQAFPPETIQILRAEYAGDYYFDGETLSKNFEVTITNHSAIPASVVELQIHRDGRRKTFTHSNLPDVLPLNIEAHYSEVIAIPWNMPLPEEAARALGDGMNETESGAASVFQSGHEFPFAVTVRTAEDKQYGLTSTGWEPVWEKALESGQFNEEPAKRELYKSIRDGEIRFLLRE